MKEKFKIITFLQNNLESRTEAWLLDRDDHFRPNAPHSLAINTLLSGEHTAPLPSRHFHFLFKRNNTKVQINFFPLFCSAFSSSSLLPSSSSSSSPSSHYSTKNKILVVEIIVLVSETTICSGIRKYLLAYYMEISFVQTRPSTLFRPLNELNRIDQNCSASVSF